MTAPTPTPKKSIFLWGAVAVCAVVIIFVVLPSLGLLPRHSSPSVDNNVVKSIEQQAAALVGTPRTITLTSEKAVAARSAILTGDFTQASTLMDEIYTHSAMQKWRFYPYSDFMDDLSMAGSPAYLGKLNEWVAKEPQNVEALLARAQYYYDTAWLLRGTSYVSETSSNGISAFEDYSSRSAADCVAAMKVDDKHPYAPRLLVRVLYGGGDSPQLEQAFQYSIAKFPAYFAVYRGRLNSLAPKWGGSIEAMYKFTEEYAGKAPDNSPLKMLYLRLYANLLDTASMVCHQQAAESQLDECMTAATGKLVTKKLENDVLTAISLHKTSDMTEYNDAINEVMYDMVRTSHGERYSGAILQLIADSIGSQNQLVGDDKGSNNYVTDRMTALVWWRNGTLENAEHKYLRAAEDIKNSNFSDEEQKDVALGKTYDDLGDVYKKMGLIEKAIAYKMAGTMLRGMPHDNEGLECQMLMQLKQYAASAKLCDNMIKAGGGFKIYAWRGQSYEGMGDKDAAIRDYTIVADSQHNFRSWAAIQMSVIYGQRNDMKGQLAELNHYQYLFDEKGQSKSDLAVAYNNRCYARMNLGQLQEALDDCTTSLRFGSLPDAYQKQQELVKRLKAKDTGL